MCQHGQHGGDVLMGLHSGRWWGSQGANPPPRTLVVWVVGVAAAAAAHRPPVQPHCHILTT